LCHSWNGALVARVCIFIVFASKPFKDFKEIASAAFQSSAAFVFLAMPRAPPVTKDDPNFGVIETPHKLPFCIPCRYLCCSGPLDFDSHLASPTHAAQVQRIIKTDCQFGPCLNFRTDEDAREFAPF
jgi:hypothetical protein